MKNKGAALTVCIVLLIASVGYYFYMQSSRNNSDVLGVEKNWWDDPNSLEQKWVEQNNYERKAQTSPTKSIVKEDLLEENRDHYADMVQLKTKHSQRYVRIKRKIQELQAQLQNASSAQEAEDIRNEITKRQVKLREIKEDDQFIQLLTGQ